MAKTIKARTELVGESWEFSLGPEFPSVVDGNGPLIEVLKAAPEHWLGPEAEAGCPLLVKLLDAGDDLSVQIHPSDGDPELASDQSGKPETWYVLHAEPDAGLYFGFRAGVTRQELEDISNRDGNLADALHFEKVTAGDFFVVPAGTPHAVGKGVAVVEPQWVAPGKKGVTYRFGDWNRRYNSAGLLDAHGVPRPLHLEEALRVSEWGISPKDLLTKCRLRLGDAARGQLAAEACCGRTFGLSSQYLEVQRVSGTGSLSLALPNRLHALTLVSGEWSLFGTKVPSGATYAIAAQNRQIELSSVDGLAILSSAL